MLYDKTGREIMHGDVLKVYHFTGHHNKKYFLYQHVLDTECHGTPPTVYFKISRLGTRNCTYLIPQDSQVLKDYEIVQGYGPDGVSFDDRPIHKPEG